MVDWNKETPREDAEFITPKSIEELLDDAFEDNEERSTFLETISQTHQY
jgi:hypothetical protein